MRRSSQAPYPLNLNSSLTNFNNPESEFELTKPTSQANFFSQTPLIPPLKLLARDKAGFRSCPRLMSNRGEDDAVKKRYKQILQETGVNVDVKDRPKRSGTTISKIVDL